MELANVLLVGVKKRQAGITFLCAVHYADAVVWDGKWRLIKHVLYLWEGGEGGGQRK